MKVIKHGKTYKITTCAYCKAEIGYGLYDVKKYGELPGKGFYYSISCPECGGRILFKDQTKEDESAGTYIV